MKIQLKNVSVPIVEDAINKSLLLELGGFYVGTEANIPFDPDSDYVVDHIHSGKAEEVIILNTGSIDKIRIELIIPQGFMFNVGNVLIVMKDGTPFASGSYAEAVEKTNEPLTLYCELEFKSIAHVFNDTPYRDIQNQLIAYGIQQNPMWSKLAQAMSSFLKPTVDAPLRELRSIRNSEGQERTIAIRNAKMLGFNYMSDELTNEDVDRISNYVGMYYPKSGTTEMARFLSFVKNTQFEISCLWSQGPDYEQGFHSTPGGITVLQEPSVNSWYPTSHVEMAYSIRHAGFSSLEKLIDMFYYLAPIHLVLERMVAYYEFAPVELKLGRGTKIRGEYYQSWGKIQPPHFITRQRIGAGTRKRNEYYQRTV